MDREVTTVSKAMLSGTDMGGFLSSSALRAASPLKGEAVACTYLTRFIASPLRGEAERSSDEGDKTLTFHKKKDGLLPSFFQKLNLKEFPSQVLSVLPQEFPSSLEVQLLLANVLLLRMLLLP